MVIMRTRARHRGAWCPVVLLVTFLVLMGGSRAALPAIGGGHVGSPLGGVAGGAHPGGAPPRGRAFGDGGVVGRRVPHWYGGRRVFVLPYFYDPYYGYDPYGLYDPPYLYAPYCDPYSPYFTPQYCYWDGAP